MIIASLSSAISDWTPAQKLLGLAIAGVLAYGLFLNKNGKGGKGGKSGSSTPPSQPPTQ